MEYKNPSLTCLLTTRRGKVGSVFFFDQNKNQKNLFRLSSTTIPQLQYQTTSPKPPEPYKPKLRIPFSLCLFETVRIKKKQSIPLLLFQFQRDRYRRGLKLKTSFKVRYLSSSSYDSSAIWVLLAFYI